MRDLKFKKAASRNYVYVRENAINWVHKYCNNGTASLCGLRQCYSWKDAYIVLCKNTYFAVPEEIFNQIERIL